MQHAPCRVPVALRTKVKEALEDLEHQEVIAPVTSPTAWISSMVTVPKKNGKLRIRLDPKDLLNRAIQREHYPLPTIEDIATWLHDTKVFTKLTYGMNSGTGPCRMRTRRSSQPFTPFLDVTAGDA